MKGLLKKENYTDEITIDIDENIKQLRFIRSQKGFHVRIYLAKAIKIDESFRRRILLHDDLLRIKFDIERYYRNKSNFTQRLFDQKQKVNEVIKIEN